MKKFLLLPLLLLFLNISCGSDDTVNNEPLEAETLLNVAYGGHAEQKMDVYLPEGRDENTPVIVLVHGGAWIAGSKEDMSFIVPVLQAEFPDHAIVNISYRLASDESPMYPKQIDDIASVIGFIENSDYEVSDDYAFIGASAGAHLSMLYAYKHDTEHDVKAVVNIVGPADFSDPAYTVHPLYESMAVILTGTETPTAEQIAEINPVAHITALAPPTLSFYGGQDPLVPSSQGPRLEAKLDEMGVYNELNFYPDGGHADWNAQIMQEVYGKIIAFLEMHMNAA